MFFLLSYEFNKLSGLLVEDIPGHEVASVAVNEPWMNHLDIDEDHTNWPVWAHTIELGDYGFKVFLNLSSYAVKRDLRGSVRSLIIPLFELPLVDDHPGDDYYHPLEYGRAVHSVEETHLGLDDWLYSVIRHTEYQGTDWVLDR